MITSHLHRNFQFWKKIYLVTKTSTQLLNLDPGGSGGETYIKWKAWMSSFRKYWLDRASLRKWWWNDAFKKWSRTKFSQMAPHVLKIYILIFFSCFCIRKYLECKKKFTYWLRVSFLWFKSMILCNLWLEITCFFGLKRTMMWA